MQNLWCRPTARGRPHRIIWHRPKPVSSTHLDVYKRQLLAGDAVGLQHVLYDVVRHAQLFRADKHEPDVLAAGHGLDEGAVSYTHLDVYKRQVLDDGTKTMPCAINVVTDEPGRTVMEMTLKAVSYTHLHPVSFRTTDVFLRCFGLSSLADLPPVRGDQEGEAAT